MQRLRPVHPRRASRVVRRDLHVTDDIFDLLAGGSAAATADFPDAHAHSLIDSFLLGEYVSVCLCGDHEADLKRLRAVDEVWVLCFRRVQLNQWRVIGRFSKPNTFVGLSIHRRGEINTWKKYNSAAQAFISKWNSTLHGRAPLRGNHWTDYLTGPVQDRDDPFS